MFSLFILINKVLINVNKILKVLTFLFLWIKPCIALQTTCRMKEATGVAQLIADNTHHFMKPLVIKIYVVFMLHSLAPAVNNISLSAGYIYSSYLHTTESTNHWIHQLVLGQQTAVNLPTSSLYPSTLSLLIFLSPVFLSTLAATSF